MNNKSDNIVLLISLARISFLNLAEKLNLLKKLDSYDDLAILSIDDLRKLSLRNIKTNSWNGFENLRAAEKEAKIIESKNIKYVLYGDENYPALLKESSNAPFMLFYIGNISCLKDRTVSVVGTRRITPEAKVAARNFSYEAALDGCTVVSGLANGVDGVAHSGCVDAWFDSVEKNEALPLGKTVAVLPCGIDTITPSCHKKLSTDIIKSGGCILSEYVPGVIAEKWRFVQRNRIIAALSPVTVVIQAPDGSGALITAQYALEYGRDVMFHACAFCDNAKNVKRVVKACLEKDFAKGKISKSKIENTCEKYIEAGAPVIKDYKDYCKCFAEMPGIRSYKIEQINLF